MTPARMPANGPAAVWPAHPVQRTISTWCRRHPVSPQAPLRAWRDTDIEAVLGINAASQPHVARLDRAEVRRLLVIGARIWVVTGTATTAIAYLIAFLRRCTVRRPGVRVLQPVDSAAGSCTSTRWPSTRNTAAAGWAGRSTNTWPAWRAPSGCARLPVKSIVVPPNPDSRLFHARAGFVTVDQLELPDGRTVELLTRDLDGARGLSGWRTQMFEPRRIDSHPAWLDADGVKLYTISAHDRTGRADGVSGAACAGQDRDRGRLAVHGGICHLSRWRDGGLPRARVVG